MRGSEPSVPLVELHNVCRDFDTGRIIALDAVSLAIACGEAIAIVGPSGSGKSPPLNLLCGLDRPGAGEIRFEGRRLRGMAERTRIRAQRIGIVFQSFCLLSKLTACENIEVATLGQVIRTPGDRFRLASRGGEPTRCCPGAYAAVVPSLLALPSSSAPCMIRSRIASTSIARCAVWSRRATSW